MARKERLDLIQKLEKKRDSKVLCYITGDRQNVGAQISSDVVRHIYDHLIAISKNRKRISKVDLFLYSIGGHGDAPWKIIRNS